MSNRHARINSYKDFRDKCNELFQSLADSDKSHTRLKSLFNLSICPKGRAGAVNEKQIEVFYGNRPIGTATTIDGNFQRQTKTEIAHGATLSYDRTDDGHIICSLYPAASENQRPIEDFILLDYIKNPGQLDKKYKKHWKFFTAYMEGTCIDGSPKIHQRIRLFYLRNFKQYAKGSVIQQRKSVLFFKEILKYVLTIGLSGFLLLVFTFVKDKIEDDAQQTQITAKELQIKLIVSDVKLAIKNNAENASISNGLLSNISKTEIQKYLILQDINENIANSEAQLITLNKKLADIEIKIDNLSKQNTVVNDE